MGTIFHLEGVHMGCNTPSMLPEPERPGQRKVFCVKFQREMPGLDEPPFDTELGRRVYENVSEEAWKMWGEHCKMLLNEYRLNPANRQDQEILAVGGIQPVFVQEHLAMLAPHLPGFLRDVFINPPAQFRVERRLVQSRHFPLELHAEDLALPWPLRVGRHLRCITAHVFSCQVENCPHSIRMRPVMYPD